MISNQDEMSLYDSIITIAPDRKIEHAAPATSKNPTGQPSPALRGSLVGMIKTIRNNDKMKRSIPMTPDATTFIAILRVRFKFLYAPVFKKMNDNKFA
jgi:hypothetical protein